MKNTIVYIFICILIWKTNPLFGQQHTINLHEFIQLKKNKKHTFENLILSYGTFNINEEKINNYLTTKIIKFSDTTTTYTFFENINSIDFNTESFYVALIKLKDTSIINKTIDEFNKNLTRYFFYPNALMKNKINYGLDKNELLDMKVLNINDVEKTNIKFKGKNILNSANNELFFEFKEVVSSQ
jgi:hypothetical protein